MSINAIVRIKKVNKRDRDMEMGHAEAHWQGLQLRAGSDGSAPIDPIRSDRCWASLTASLLPALCSLCVSSQEYREVRESQDGSGVSAELVGESFTHWKGSLLGPEGTPYAGGRFVVDIQVRTHDRKRSRRQRARPGQSWDTLTAPCTGHSASPFPSLLVSAVRCQIPPNYPFEPPKMRFDTKVWHPNVSSQNGAICLDILKNEW